MVMDPQKEDRRVIRTRQLIQEAFISLSREKEFSDITIRDITERAQINRATFYAHFADKYMLLEFLVSETFGTLVARRVSDQEGLTVEPLRNLILAVCDFHEEVSKKCRRAAMDIAPFIEMKIKIQLEDMVVDWLTRNKAGVKKKKWAAVMISQSIYSVAYRWNEEGRECSSSMLADEVLPFLLAGLGDSRRQQE